MEAEGGDQVDLPQDNEEEGEASRGLEGLDNPDDSDESERESPDTTPYEFLTDYDDNLGTWPSRTKNNIELRDPFTDKPIISTKWFVDLVELRRPIPEGDECLLGCSATFSLILDAMRHICEETYTNLDVTCCIHKSPCKIEALCTLGA
jgi:hypothetical protein